jgi:outer membrane protein assembly factor BamB
VEGGALAGPVVADDRVIVVAADRVVALDAASGDLVWDAIRSAGPAGTAAVAGGLVIHASGREADAGIVGRDLADGVPRWRVSTGSTVTAGITVAGSRVYVGTSGGTVLAVEARTGKVAWRSEVSGSVAAAPAVAEGLVVAVAQEETVGATTVEALDADSGKERWRFSPPPATPGGTGAAVGDGVVFVGLGDAQVHALDLDTGVERWAARTPATVLGTAVFFTAVQTPAISGDPVIADLAHLARFGAPTGDELWTFRFPDLVATSGPAVAGDWALVGDGGGTVSAVDLDEGVLVWRLDLTPDRATTSELSVATLAADGNRLYAATLGPAGRVVALEHDPNGSLIRVESATTLFPVAAVLNFAVAGAAVGLVTLGLFRYVLRPRGERTP